jgi:type IV pilus assembly protein PilB
MRKQQRLGELLEKAGLVDEIQLRVALSFHSMWGVPLGQVVVDKGFCTAQQVLEVLASQLQLPVVDLDAQPMDEALMDVLPVETAEACRVVPLRLEGPRGSVLVVAAAAPAPLTAMDEVARVAGKARVSVLLATDAAISRAIDRLYYPHLIGACRPVEPIPLPEADEVLPLVRGHSECLALGFSLQKAAAQAQSTEQGGLPILLPLVTEVPADERVTQPNIPAVPRAPAGTAVAEPEPQVWVYGWGAKATDWLLSLLKAADIRARVARTEDVVKASERAVVLTPLQSVESVMRHGIRAQLLMAGRAHDRHRALALGAHVFLSGPLRTPALIAEVLERVRGAGASLRRVG